MKNILALLLVSIIFITGCNKCDDSQCLNNGICVDGDCLCDGLFEGSDCEISCIDKFDGTWTGTRTQNGETEVFESTTFTQQSNSVVSMNNEDFAVLLSMNDCSSATIVLEHGVNNNIVEKSAVFSNGGNTLTITVSADYGGYLESLTVLLNK